MGSSLTFSLLHRAHIQGQSSYRTNNSQQLCKTLIDGFEKPDDTIEMANITSILPLRPRDTYSIPKCSAQGIFFYRIQDLGYKLSSESFRI